MLLKLLKKNDAMIAYLFDHVVISTNMLIVSHVVSRDSNPTSRLWNSRPRRGWRACSCYPATLSRITVTAYRGPGRSGGLLRDPSLLPLICIITCLIPLALTRLPLPQRGGSMSRWSLPRKTRASRCPRYIPAICSLSSDTIASDRLNSM